MLIIYRSLSLYQFFTVTFNVSYIWTHTFLREFKSVQSSVKEEGWMGMRSMLLLTQCFCLSGKLISLLFFVCGNISFKRNIVFFNLHTSLSLCHTRPWQNFYEEDCKMLTNHWLILVRDWLVLAGLAQPALTVTGQPSRRQSLTLTRQNSDDLRTCLFRCRAIFTIFDISSSFCFIIFIQVRLVQICQLSYVACLSVF